MLTVKFARSPAYPAEDVKAPKRAYPSDAGFDLYAARDVALEGPSNRVPTGIRLELPEGWCAVIKDRSGNAMKGLRVAAGVIDTGYRGDIDVVLDSLVPGKFQVKKGDRIAQLLLVPNPRARFVEVVAVAQATERGGDGFGSTGVAGE